MEKKDLQGVINAHFGEIVEIKGVIYVDAWIHPTYRIFLKNKPSVFLRFPARKKSVHFGDDYSFDKDVWVSNEILNSTNVKVPTITCKGKYVDIEFLILEYLEGVNLREFSEGNIQNTSPQIIRDWGSAMAQIHKIKSDDFGYIGKEGIITPYNKWGEVVEEYFERKLNFDIIDSELREGARNLFDRLKETLDVERDPSFVLYNVHGDNIIIRDGKFYGISDVMLALFGHISLDFMFPHFFGVDKLFRKGYIDAGGRVPENLGELTTINLLNYYMSTIENYKDADDVRRKDISNQYTEKLRLLLKENEVI